MLLYDREKCRILEGSSHCDCSTDNAEKKTINHNFSIVKHYVVCFW